MLNSEQRRERDTGDGQQWKMFLVLLELSFKKAEAFGYFRPTKVPRRRQKEKPEMITEIEFNSAGSSFSFLFRRKAKRKEKPEEKIQLQMKNPCRSFTGRVLFVLEFNYYRLIPASRKP